MLLSPAIARLRKVRALNPERNAKKSCVYVGLTGLTPEERFVNHQKGVKSSFYVKRYGIQLLPELYTHLNPMPYGAAAQMEKDLTEDLRKAGYTVVGVALNESDEKDTRNVPLSVYPPKLRIKLRRIGAWDNVVGVTAFFTMPPGVFPPNRA